ncbi:uncharacterized protein LOC127749167 [Frankliniella occidentalis]|uniref:Uncharacterized protein LOC127749167 n=1 Tax=Frankliniella occidentalis TaxID=133901 RepID=A0A9C6TTR2_FRAOC|nr:uncharacterized protein LOC127749167 [Frankliniella occidentalis]
MTSIIHVDQKSGYATVETLDNGPKESNNNQKIRPPSPSGGTLIINSKFEEDSPSQPLHQLPLIKDALIPFSNMLSKFRKTSSTKPPANSCPIAPQSRCDSKDLVPEESDSIDESGEYVTITDMRNNNKPSSLPQCPPQRSEISESVCESTAKTWENQEYVSLNEIPAPDSSKHPAASVLSGSSSESSLERKKRQGARVMLDSEGKVVYSSDSLRRRKGAHTTFAPGQFVKDTSVSPSPSPVARHRMPKSIIRPVQSQASGLPHGINNRSPSHSASKSLLSETSHSGGSVPRPLSLQTRPITSFERGSAIQPSRASMLQTSDLLNQRNNRVIIRAGLVSPTEDLTNCSMRSMSPRNTTPTRGAYVHVQPDNRPTIKTNPMFLQTDFDGPDDVSLQRESQQPQNNSEGKKAVSTNRNVLTIGGEIGEALKNKKVQRSASYRMANFSPLISVCDVDINKDQGDGDVDQGVADLGEARPKLSLSPNVSYNSAENVLNVLNPNMTGRRFYGAQVMVSPNILLSLSPNRVTKPADTQRAKVLSTADCSTYIRKRDLPEKTQHAEDPYTIISPNQPIYQNLKLGRDETKIVQQYEPRYAASPASINRFMSPEMQNSGRTIQAPLHSSTPTKPDSANASPLTNNTFSPIERHVSCVRNEGMQESFSFPGSGKSYEREEKKPQLVLSPKSTMTTEELYAKIHKSKKQMNLKYEPEIVLSPSPSIGSQSPVGSDRSVSPATAAAAATDPRLAARSRHSWSPNSSKYLDIASNYDARSNTPSPNLRVPKDHGLTQVTSTYDFKRLLLQHGASSSGKSRMSAVERLKQAKQAATNVITSNAPKFRFGSLNSKPVSINPTSTQSVPSKVIPSKSTLLKPGPKSSLRFAAHRNDVRATPILEDQHGEERATEVLQIQQLSASPMAGRNVGRMLNRLARSQDPVQCPPCPIYSELGEPIRSQTVLPKHEFHQYPSVLGDSQHVETAPIFPQTNKFPQYSKQLKIVPGQKLPTTLEEPDYSKLRNESPTALETAL